MAGAGDIAFPVGYALALAGIALAAVFCCNNEQPADDQREPQQDRRAPRAARRALAAGQAARAAGTAATTAAASAKQAARPVVLPYFPYAQGRKPETAVLLCAICLDELRQGQLCSEVPSCRHVFHRDCISIWARSNGSCPLCRAKIVPGAERVAVADDMV
ncbi:hypothetical protein ACP70R_028201 [Stipagrostis hirtigluma subsp. patula]